MKITSPMSKKHVSCLIICTLFFLITENHMVQSFSTTLEMVKDIHTGLAADSFFRQPIIIPAHRAYIPFVQK